MPATAQALLHRRLTTLLALSAILAFVSGAGVAGPVLLPATGLLVLSLFWNPSQRLRRALELCWRMAAVLLAARAGYHALFVADDVVLPMVDLLLVLLLAETYRAPDGMGEPRLYALSFALLIAATAYRPGSLFGLAFAAYLAVLTAALTVGQLRRQARVRGVRLPPIDRRFLLQSAMLSGIALLISLLVFLAFPRVSWGARGGSPMRSVVGFADHVSLLEHGGRIYSNPEVVLRVEFPGRTGPPPGPLYWRGRSYDHFDGWTWSQAPIRPQQLIEPSRWPQARVAQLIYQSGIDDANVLFGLSPLLHVDPRSRIVAYPDLNGDFTYGGPAAPVYLSVSVLGQPTSGQLRSASASAFDPPGATGMDRRRAAVLEAAALRPYLRLPLLSPRFYALADSLAAPQATAYDRAVAVRDWLRANFRYTVELPRTTHAASLEYFLFERRAGHCEYFSTAMAMLLRAAGVPARNVNGFLGGEWNRFGDFLTVTQNQAHSWVEVWFPGYGWVSFDPTPAATGGLGGATRGSTWLAPFRLLFGGLEHRWGKWVLDYDIDDQVRLLERTAGGWRAATHTTGGAWQVPRRPVLAVSLGLVILGLAGAFLRARRSRARGHGPAGDVTRAYLRLRRAYARAGYTSPSPPLTFLAQLQQANAPGAAEAAGAIQLYTRLRFGGAGADAAERRQLHRQVTLVRRTLRLGRRQRARRGRERLGES